MPAFVKNFVIDAVETAIALVFALNIAFPGSVEDAKAAALLIGSAILAAVVSAARRAAPGFVAWLRELLKAPAA